MTPPAGITGLKRAGKTSLLATRWYARRLGHDVFPGVVVLCYHGLKSNTPTANVAFGDLHLTEETFIGHCKLIAQMCHPISLADWRAALAGRRRLPLRPVLVTFDDGYRRVFTRARPILRQFNIPAVVFACADPIERRRLPW